MLQSAESSIENAPLKGSLLEEPGLIVDSPSVTFCCPKEFSSLLLGEVREADAMFYHSGK